MRRRFAAALCAAAVPIALAGAAFAEMVVQMDVAPPIFQLTGAAPGGTVRGNAPAAFTSSSRIAAVGDGALVIDADSGQLVRTDHSGAAIASLPIGANAGLLAYDPNDGRAFVADRAGDRIAVVTVGKGLQLAASWPTPSEPFAVALTPDRKTLLVTTVASRSLVAYDTATGAETWRVALAAEPRGLAVSPDGARAMIAHLTTGTVESIPLSGDHQVEAIALRDTTFLPSINACAHCPSPAPPPSPPTYARSAFAVAFLGDHEAVVPYAREMPVQATGAVARPHSYGGGFEPPITQQLAFVDVGPTSSVAVNAQIAQNEPRALAWDGAHDALYIAGLGTDTIMQLRQASTTKIAAGATMRFDATKDRCGPDGLAIAPDGAVWVWCSFSRQVAHVVPTNKPETGELTVATTGKSIAPSSLSEPLHRGMVSFNAALPEVSQRGALACASCHPEGRADGLSWQIDTHPLQTPILAGRVADTGPYKWDGSDPTLMASMTSTMTRLGGFGFDEPGTRVLAAYVAQLPPVRAPLGEAAAVARGKQLFDGAFGCRGCHDGADFTDRQKHALKGTLAEVDTPSLRGLAASAPYFHDGSAPTLEDVLRDRGEVHGMADTSAITAPQVADLVAYLQTL